MELLDIREAHFNPAPSPTVSGATFATIAQRCKADIFCAGKKKVVLITIDCFYAGSNDDFLKRDLGANLASQQLRELLHSTCSPTQL